MPLCSGEPLTACTVDRSQLACLESIVDRLSLVVDPPSTLVDNSGYSAPPLTTDQICEFLELLHPLLNRWPALPRL